MLKLSRYAICHNFRLSQYMIVIVFELTLDDYLIIHTPKPGHEARVGIQAQRPDDQPEPEHPAEEAARAPGHPRSSGKQVRVQTSFFPEQ